MCCETEVVGEFVHAYLVAPKPRGAEIDTVVSVAGGDAQ